MKDSANVKESFIIVGTIGKGFIRSSVVHARGETYTHFNQFSSYFLSNVWLTELINVKS